MSAPPTHIRIVEVGPRDGLQNERPFVPTADKIAFVNNLADAGHTTIEVSAFVSPTWVPQMADAAEVFAGITRLAGVRYTALVPNLIGLSRAQEAGADEVAVFPAASETFSKRNINQTVDEALATANDICREAQTAGLRVRAYLSTSFGCPFEGAVAPARVAELATRSVLPIRGRCQTCCTRSRSESRSAASPCTSTTHAAPRSSTCTPASRQV